MLVKQKFVQQDIHFSYIHIRGGREIHYVNIRYTIFFINIRMAVVSIVS